MSDGWDEIRRVAEMDGERLFRSRLGNIDFQTFTFRTWGHIARHYRLGEVREALEHYKHWLTVGHTIFVFEIPA